jgi:hypothetical protein
VDVPCRPCWVVRDSEIIRESVPNADCFKPVILLSTVAPNGVV